MKNQAKKALIRLAPIVVSCIILFCAFQVLRPQAAENAGLQMEDNAIIGVMPGIDNEQRLRELQEQLDKSMIAFSINATPVYTDGNVNLMLENPEHNDKLLVAQLFIDTDKLYESNAIRPGSYLDQIQLSRMLPPGNYDATVYLKAYDVTTEEYIGETGAVVKFTV